MSDSELLEKWFTETIRSLVALVIGIVFVICCIPAMLLGDWIGTVCLASAAEIIWLLTERARRLRYAEMREYGYGHLISH